MSLPAAPWYTEADESYWCAIVSQGQWVTSSLGDQPLPAALASRAPLRNAEEDQRWSTLAALFADGSVVPLTVTGFNRGGLLVAWEGMQGFIPTSQLSEAPLQAAEGERMAYLAEQVGQNCCGKVIELDRAQNRIIFSERAARWGECCPDAVLATLQAGAICEGEVSNLCDFGVFVDLGGVDGLIHISELSWWRVGHPSELLTVGQRIRVYVIDVDMRRRRIALSLKRLQPNPWAAVAERYRAGMVVRGVVTNIVDFGLFARVAEGVEGLIHSSEYALAEDGQPQSLREGDTVYARVLSVDADNQRLSLSLRGTPVPHEQA